MRLILLIFIFLSSVSGYSAAPGHGAEEIPWKFIGVQVLNIVIFGALLIYFTKGKVVQLFRERHENYAVLLKNAQAARLTAEENKREIKERLNKLQATADQSIQQAKSEAEALRQKIVAEAKELSTRLQEEARKTAHFEVERAKALLREELLKGSLDMASNRLQQQVGSEQKRLNSEFVEKIQVVRS